MTRSGGAGRVGFHADGKQVAVGQEAAGFGIGVDPGINMLVDSHLLGDDLLLKQRTHDHGAGAGGHQAFQLRAVIRQR